MIDWPEIIQQANKGHQRHASQKVPVIGKLVWFKQDAQGEGGPNGESPDQWHGPSMVFAGRRLIYEPQPSRGPGQ